MTLPQLSPRAWITLQLAFSQAFALLLFAVQAPLLGPTAFGLVSIALIFVGFCELVLEAASIDALLSVRTIDAAHYRSMTSVGVLVGLLFGGTALLAAERIADLFDAPELVPLLQGMAVLPLLSGLIVAPAGAAHRAMRFDAIAMRSIIGIGGSGVVGLAMAVAGFGVWALVVQTVLQRVLGTLSLWLGSGLRFELGWSSPKLAELWRYGSPMLASQVMHWGAEQAMRFVIGLQLGAAGLGLFALAIRLGEILVQLSIVPAYGVARVELRRLLDDLQPAGDDLHALLQRMAFLAFPMAIGGAVTIPLLFEVWLDEKWQPGVPIAQCLLLGGVPAVLIYGLAAVLVAINQQRLHAREVLARSLLQVGAAALAGPFGPVATAAALSLRSLLTTPLLATYVQRCTGVSPRRIVAALARPLLVAGLMGAAVAAVIAVARPLLPAGAVLALAVAAGIAVYAGLAAWLLPTLLQPLLAKLSRRSRSSSSSPPDTAPE